ncbi:ribokinase [Lysobacter pythonis]|uniref:Ribokinase n=1 Tax=Solilutibacter pythonis TaxID=2483112 RepID=A0A3M2HYY1_9GAMM|nr:ribokinase [Lysobacter pythonis]RMH91054.1 ribokinase [Lysobacter pythonis]
MSGKVVVVGSFNVDHVWRCDALPAPGATLAGRYACGPGGKGFNQAMAARRAGADTRFICALGDDDGGRLARRLAKADGIALAAMAARNPTGTAGIFVDAAGRNSIVIGPGANAELSLAHVEAEHAAIAAADVLLAQLESPAEAIGLALATARGAGRRTVLNPAPANAGTERSLLAQADILTPNETEFAALIARHTALAIPAQAVASAADDALHLLCRTLHPAGSVVLTLGALGSFVSHPEGALRGDSVTHYRIAATPARTLDTTGAGDAFNGALCASMALRADVGFARHVDVASRYAARSTERTGAALSMPYLPAG